MLWDVQTGQVRFAARPVTNHVHRLVFSLDARFLAIADGAKKSFSDTGQTPILQ
jgi:hypothetical protein